MYYSFQNVFIFKNSLKFFLIVLKLDDTHRVIRKEILGLKRLSKIL